MRYFLAILTVLFTASTTLAPANELTRQKIVLKSALSVDLAGRTVTLPIYRGTHDGTNLWYIITDASDVSVAKRLGVVYSPSLASIGAAAIQQVANRNGDYQFAGAPDFSPTRSYVASAAGFPPKSAQPGSTSDAQYSPFVRLEGTPGVLNISVIATGDGPYDVTAHTNTADRVVAIDSTKKTATIILARGVFNGRATYYLSTEASDPVAATVERAIYVPKLAKASSSAEIPLGVIIDGPKGGESTSQGLDYLALDTPLGDDATAANATTIGSPFNILAVAPDLKRPYADVGYSPLWDIQVQAKAAKRITSYAAFVANSKPAGFVVNCPVVAFADASDY